MKLVDILARQLKGWPEGAVFAVQDLDGEVKFDNSEKRPRINKSNDVWIRQGDHGDTLHSQELAEDFSYAIVNRAQWQAAFDALKAAENAFPEWNGEGLPPVGTVCAVLNSDLGSPQWERCTILYSGKHRVVYDSESCEERVALIEDLRFRPARSIRTPEQIVAEQLRNDELMYGTSYAVMGEGGSLERIDPTKIIIRHRGA